MRLLPATILPALLLMPLSAICAEPPPSTPAKPVPAKPDRPQPKKPQEVLKGEWLDPDQSAPNGTQYKTFHSAVIGSNVSYLVWLPPGYERGTKRYPVIYWLHGRSKNQRTGALIFVPQVEAAIKEGLLPPVIVVSVNGVGPSYYLDAPNGRLPVESVIIKDLIPHVDRTYRTIARREGRVIEGYSMGGFGAARLGFKFPELFGTVVVSAGALQNSNGFNPEEHPKQLARKNAGKLRKTRIHIGCGSLDGLLPTNLELHRLLQQLGIEHSYQVVPDMAHDSALYYEKLGTKVFEFHRRSLEALDKGR
ncbi:MAG: alpha/beta hydrolase-fold protein [Verrucomicrobiia bacterium]